MAVLDCAGQQVPVSINDGGERADNCYVVSPLTAYTGYADEELRRLDRPLLAWPLHRLISAVSALLRCARIDRIVQINNWLLSTNLYPADWPGEQLEEMTASLRQRFPDHVLCLRSLNRHSNAELIDRLLDLGYLAIPSRQVYLFDGREGERAAFRRRHNSRMDAILLRRSPYQVVTGDDLEDADFQRLEQLYNLLYLDKYCVLNPHYSAEWIRRGQRDGWLQLRVLRTDEGRIDGVVGWFANAQIISAPLVGYDTALPQRAGLYRQLTQLCLQEAARRRVLLNFSSGAAGFKRLRGGEAQIEYSLVYVAHLGWARRLVWRVLATLLHGIGVPLMRTLKL